MTKLKLNSTLGYEEKVAVVGEKGKGKWRRI
jgi:hypothetical protein